MKQTLLISTVAVLALALIVNLVLMFWGLFHGWTPRMITIMGCLWLPLSLLMRWFARKADDAIEKTKSELTAKA